MGKIWLHQLDLPHFLEKWGIDFHEYNGWEGRSRSSGGFDYIWAIQCHHTVSDTSPANDMAYMWLNASTKPIGNVFLDRTGRVWLGASGASNTSGKGGPRLTANGTLPLDVGNTRIVAIEAANNGIGETWPEVQQIAYLKLCCAIKDCIDSSGVNQHPIGWGDVHSHREWAPLRKVDTRGPSRWGTGILPWDMDRFRGDVAFTWLAFHAQQPVPPPVVEPAPIPPPVVEPAPPWETNRWLWEGAYGDDVTWLQRVLKAQVPMLTAGFYPQADSAARQMYLIAAKDTCAKLVDDGQYGAVTAQAVSYTGLAFDWTAYNDQHIGPCNFKDGRIGPGPGNGWEFVYRIADGIWY